MLSSARKIGVSGSRRFPYLFKKSLVQGHRSLSYIPRITERRPGEEGPGGRCSNAGIKVAVFGAGGFLGRYICANLGNNGILTYIGNRGCDLELRHLKVSYDLGRSRFVFYSPHDIDSMADVIADADVVINLIGKHYDTKVLADIPKFPFLTYKTNFSLEQANVLIPQTIAKLCKDMQVDNLIHVSSLSASNPDPSSEFTLRKKESEDAVLAEFPWATIVRPADMFGSEDRLLNWFANTSASLLPAVPLVDEGEAITQPVWVNDVASAITRVLDDPSKFEGKVVECFGPQDFTYKELAEFVYDITCQEKSLLPIPKSILLHFANLMQYQPYPMLTPDMVEYMSEDCLPSMTEKQFAKQNHILTLKDLDIEPLAIEKEAFNYLHRFRTGGHFILAEGLQGVKTVKPTTYGR